MDRVLPFTHEDEGSPPTGGTCPHDFSGPTDQDIRTQCALNWKIVVSEWRSVIAVSFNVGGGVHFITAAKLYMYTLPKMTVIYFKAQNFLETTALDKVCYIDTNKIFI